MIDDSGELQSGRREKENCSFKGSGTETPGNPDGRTEAGEKHGEPSGHSARSPQGTGRQEREKRIRPRPGTERGKSAPDKRTSPEG